MLTFISLLLFIACVFGFKQSIALKNSQDLNNKQSLELSLVRSTYQNNLSCLSQALKDKEALNSEIEDLLKEIRALNSELRLAQDNQLDIEKFEETIDNHILNVLSHIDLQDAYERLCEYHDLEIEISDLIK